MKKILHIMQQRDIAPEYNKYKSKEPNYTNISFTNYGMQVVEYDENCNLILIKTTTDRQIKATELSYFNNTLCSINLTINLLGVETSDYKAYNADGYLIHRRRNEQFYHIEEYIAYYDDTGKISHYKDSNGKEYWNDYDENGNLIHHKDSDGLECWYEYDENGIRIYKDSEGNMYYIE